MREKTNDAFYELFAYEEHKDSKKIVLTKQELIVSLTIIRKVTKNRDFAPLLFFVYTRHDSKHIDMFKKEISLFRSENQWCNRRNMTA